MKKLKPVVVAMAVVMLVQTLASCTSAKKKANVVKEDDPWYESTIFDLEKKIGKTDELCGSGVCTSDDRLFSIYTITPDRYATCNTLLDVYDFDGNLINRQKVECTDGYYVQSIFSMSADPDGKNLSGAVFLNNKEDYGPAFVNIDTETGKVTDRKDIYSSRVLAVRMPDSTLYSVTNIGDYSIVILEGDFSGNNSGRWQLLLYKDREFTGELDLSALNIRFWLDGFSIDESTSSLYAAGYEEDDVVTLEFDLNNGKVKNKKSLLDSGDAKVNIAEYIPTDNGELCQIDSFGNITKVDVATMTPRTMVDTNWYTPFFHSLNTEECSSYSTVLNCREDRTVILNTKSVIVGLYDPDYFESVTVLKKADKNPHAGKEIIELALPLDSDVSEYLARSVYEFNKSDNEYLIRVWDKHKNGFPLGRMVQNADENETRLYEVIQDLRGDDAPDLVIDIQKQSVMSDDIFMDLSGFLDPEVLDKQYNNILEAGRIDGKLYFLPVTLEIEGFVINEDLVKDGAAGITFEEYEKLLADDLHGFSPYDYPFSAYSNKRDFILSCIDMKSVMEGDRVDFGTEQFLTAVEYARDNFVYDDEASIPIDYLYDWNHRFRSECCYIKINDFLEYVHACYRQKARYTIIGTPSVDASGPRFKALETISVSANTDVKDGCKKFLNYLFSGSACGSDNCGFRNIVTNREIMAKNIEALSEWNNDKYALYRAQVENGVFIPAPGVEIAYADKYATEGMSECFQNSMSTISTYYYEDQKIVGFMMEELTPYFAGDRSIDDVVKYLNDRTAKYVGEM